MSEGSVLGVALDIHVVLQPDNLWLEDKDEGASRGDKNQLFFLCSVSETLCLQGLGTHRPEEQER